jgi:autotransporter-associated beta strand protein
MKAITRYSEIQNRASRARRALVTSIASLLTAHAGFAIDATFSSGEFKGNADSGVSSTKTYTAIANIIGGDVVVNGATFVGSGGAVSGTGWDLVGAGNQFPGGGIHQPLGGASIANLFDAFQYNGNPATMTLSGLTAGQTYVATFYNQAWTLGDNRTQNVSSTEGASIVYNEDALAASVLRYSFVATGETTTLNFLPQIAGTTMHFYGLSNEQVFTNTWSPNVGSTWNNTANWSSGVIPNAQGTNASFPAQAGPTDVSLGGSRTVGHVQFLGTSSYTLTGSVLRFLADAGGSSVLKTDAGSSHTIDAEVSLQSDLTKFGGGSVTFNQQLFGSKGVTVGGGTVRFGAVNDYSGATTVDAGATLDFNGTSQNLTALNGAGTVLNNNSGTSAVTVQSGNFSGVIADHTVGTGIVALTKTTSGVLKLGGSHTYTGATTISGGTLRLVGTGTSTNLLTDNFTATGNPDTFDLNFNLENRQTGSAALQSWTPAGNTQVGNPTFVQQGAGTNADYLLLAFGGSAALNGLPLSTANVPGPLKISVDMFKGNSGDVTDWVSLVVRAAGGNGFPITGSGEFGFLYRQNTGTQLFNNGGLLQDRPAPTTGGDHFEFYLADSEGTGSPFAGNGTKLVITQGGATIGGFNLDTGLTPTSYITFGSGGTKIGGVDNLVVSDTVTYQTNVLLPTTNVDLNAAGAVSTLLKCTRPSRLFPAWLAAQ